MSSPAHRLWPSCTIFSSSILHLDASLTSSFPCTQSAPATSSDQKPLHPDVTAHPTPPPWVPLSVCRWERYNTCNLRMGRPHLNKLPNHLLLSPPPTPPTNPSYPFASSLLSVKSAVYQAPSAATFQDAYNARAVGDKIPGFRTSAGEY